MAPDADRLTVPVPRKPRMSKCTICREPFVKRSMTHKACKPECAAIVAQRKREKEQRKAAAAQRTQTRAQKEALKTVPELIAEAQKEFNAWIRFRDRDQPCICCGKWAPKGESLTGGGWDAAHYRSRGSAGHLRFDENNCHHALKRCNTHGHSDYRGGLIARIGLEAVEALEANNVVVKWTKDGLREIRDTYRAKLKAEMKAAKEKAGVSAN
jgi:hypothetical protein